MSDTQTPTPPHEKPRADYQALPENMDKDIRELYGDAVLFLDDNFAYFLTHVLNIGKPRWTSAVPTAAVAVDPKVARTNVDDAFSFIFNQNFARSLTTSENAFVMAHETMHILLNHLKLCKSKTFTDKTRFNVAADCVINDYLMEMGLEPPTGLCLGPDIVNYNCAMSTVSDVYHDLPDDIKDPEPCDGSCQPGGQGQPCDGSCGKAQPGQGNYPGRSIDDHDWMHKADQGQQDAAEQVGNNRPQDLDRLKQDDDYKSNVNPGYGIGGRKEFSELRGVGLKWAELLEKVDPFLFRHGFKPAVSWHRTPRKLAAIGGTRLPVPKPGEKSGRERKPAIVMALDTSGSIGQEQANQFVNMARSVPDTKIKLFVCTFTSRYQELDLENPVWESGGTDFDPISQYIEEKVKPFNRKKYPSAVIVVTDGYASFAAARPNEKEAKSWYWLLTEDGTEDYSGNKLPGTIDKLNKYRKGE